MPPKGGMSIPYFVYSPPSSARRMPMDGTPGSRYKYGGDARALSGGHIQAHPGMRVLHVGVDVSSPHIGPTATNTATRNFGKTQDCIGSANPNKLPRTVIRSTPGYYLPNLSDHGEISRWVADMMP